LIEENTKHIGFCARYGGEEFAVIIPDCNKECGVEIGELIRQAIEKTDFKGANILPKGRLTVSVGVVCFPESADSKEQLIQKADEAMYKAKYTSKNKVEVYYSVLDEMGHSLQDKEKDLLNSLRTLLMVVNAKDRYTYGHSERVMHYAMQIGKRLALWEWEIQELSVGALLHDIGKIEISREVLNKPGKLTPEEWEAVKQHPVWGADMIRPISSLGGAVDIVLHHHENYDGSGYPNALKGEEIPLGARILRVVDSFDAMTTNRPYKDALSMKQALEELNKYKGIHYDPEVVEVFTGYIIDTGIIAEKALA
jgi:HD-GYP domain-containing protein (c-di-GMP phosphodiesterase class II)